MARPDLHGVGRWLLPAAIVDAGRRRARLVDQGAPSGTAWRIGLSRTRWNALVNSRLGLLPFDELAQLRTIVDVGANQGDWTGAALEVSNPEVLICVEPSSRLVAELRARFQGRPEVSVVHAAAGADAGHADLLVTDHSHNSSLVAPTGLAEEVLGDGMRVAGTERVAVVRLDDVVPAGPVSLLKIDVQGFERSALAGAPEVLARTRWLLIEALYFHQYEGDLLFGELHELVTGLGFELRNQSDPFVRSGRAVFSDLLYRGPA